MMKRLMQLLILTFLFIIGCSFTSIASEPVQIGLYYGSSAPQSLTLSGEQLSIGAENVPLFSNITLTVSTANAALVSPQPVTDAAQAPVFVNSEGVFALYQEAPPAEAVSRTFANTAVQIHQNGVLVAVIDLPGGVAVSDLSDDIVFVNDREYAGQVVLRPSTNATLTVINRLDIESYLCGVLPYEMSTGWPLEALKAQAVAARNYVSNNRTKHQSDGFDLCNTTHCQVYRGIAAQAADCTQAVLETAGVYLYYQDKPAQTFYFSSSGGRTENVKDVWGSSFPYLVSVEDSYEKTAEIASANWNYTLSRSALEELLKNYNLGTISDLSIVSTTDGGRAKVLKAVGSLASAEIKAADFRSLVGNSSIKGTYFTITKSGGAELTVRSSTETLKNGGTAYVLSANNTPAVQSINAVLGKDGIRAFASSFEQLTFTGKGYGHGVGMSQWGARGMAEAGFTYDQILTHYFVGTELRTEE